MLDDAYTRSKFWLSEGWETLKQTGWQAPLYWECDASDETGWRVFTLRGWCGLYDLLDTPVCHISLFEADAFARWRGCRLPTEAEWECARTSTTARKSPRHREVASCDGERCGCRPTFRGLLGVDRQRLYRVSRIQAPSCALGEYNRKFMCGQMVLRGGSCVTRANHVRRPMAIFFSRRRGGSSPESVWQPKRVFRILVARR